MISAARSFSLLVAAATFAAVIATPAHAQTAPVSRAPLGLGGSLVVGGDWLQANALPLNRDAVKSARGGSDPVVKLQPGLVARAL